MIPFFLNYQSTHIPQNQAINHAIMLSNRPTIGAIHVRDSMMKLKTVPLLEKTYKEILDISDLFENSANLRIYDDVPMQLEDTIIRDAIKMAEGFIDKLRARHRKLQIKTHKRYRELSPTSLVKMHSSAFPEVLMNQVMSFLPTVYRWDSLRQKYTNAFLLQGLHKKNVARLKVIFHRLHEEASRHVDYMKQHAESTVGALSVHNSDNRLIKKTYHKWHIACTKALKVDAIVSLYLALERAHSKTIVKKSLYEDFCARMIKILHMLVIAVKPSPKKPRAARKPKATAEAEVA